VDTTTVTINRLLRGTSPFVGGKDHTTHHLSYAGLGDAQVALTFAALGGVSLLLTFVELRFIGTWNDLHSVLYVGYCLTVAFVLYGLTKRTPRRP
jgi:UDP-GlcNAc:undecaprenyl-phosphate GlcNAc-1-phosphate transferase